MAAGIVTAVITGVFGVQHLKLVAGMQMILSRMINNRRMFMVGLSITVGAAIILMPELASGVPRGLKPILGSGLTMGILTAMILD